MAQIELPERGQPLDISYIYKLVQQIQKLQDALGNVFHKIN